MNVYTTDLIKYLASRNRRPKQHYQDAIREVFIGIGEQLSRGHKVQITNFGMFYVGLTRAGTVPHFKTKQPIKYPAGNTVRFRPDSTLKNAVPKPHKKNRLARLLKGKAS